jgi:phosphotransferase system IIA component
MRASSSFLGSSGMATGLTITAIAIAVILLASNFTIINAQQQFGQSGGIENGTIFQSTDDSFSIRVPQGWVIQDVNNTGPAFNDERTQGYGILAQLCPEEQQRAASPANASGGGSTNTISSIDISSCRGAQDVVHIIRYPDLDTRLFANNVTTNSNVTTTDSILTYHLQKLQEVGYRSMQIVNSTDVTSNLIHPQTNETITTAPGKFVEMTFSTNVTPNEISRGYFILTATNATAPSLGATKGYSVFYEGNSTTSTTAAEITTATASLPPPPSIAQLFDSFELIAAAEVAEQAAEDDDDDDGNGDDGNGDDGNGDDGNGGEGEGNEGEGNPNEFDDCIVPPGMDPGDVGC